MTPKFSLGDRVRIRCSWSEADQSIGIITQPPENVRTHMGTWQEYVRHEKTRTGRDTIVYWVSLVVDELEPGDIDGGEFDEDSLELLLSE